MGSDNAKHLAAYQSPEFMSTILLATPKARAYYTESEQKETSLKCRANSNFPLALKQQKQADHSQLYYSYSNIKVSQENLASKEILQSYHFRVNVTSRMYWEVGMHMMNNHVDQTQ